MLHKETIVYFILVLFLLLKLTTSVIDISEPTQFFYKAQNSTNINGFRCHEVTANYIMIKVIREPENNFKYDILVSNYQSEVSSYQSQYIFAQSGPNDHFVYFRNGIDIPQPAAVESEFDMIFYVNILTQPGNIGSYTMLIDFVDFIDITQRMEYSFISSGWHLPELIRFNRTQQNTDIVVYAINGNSYDYEFKIKFFDGDYEIKNEYELIEKAFYGGKLYILKKDFLDSIPYYTNQFFLITFNSHKKNSIKIGLDYPHLSNKHKFIYIGKTVYNYVDRSISENNCYKIKYQNESKFSTFIGSLSGVRVFLSDRPSGKIKTKEKTFKDNGLYSFTKENIETYTYICFTPIEGKTIAFFESKIINASDLSLPQVHFDPLFHGIHYNYELQANEYQIYQDFKSVGVSEYHVYKVMKHSGNLDVFLLQTTNFPKIEFNNETEKIIPVNEVNGVFAGYSGEGINEYGHPWSSEQNLIVVHCREENKNACLYDIIFYSIEEIIYLKENFEFTQSYDTFYYTEYSFTVADKSIEAIYLEISTKYGILPLIDLFKEEHYHEFVFPDIYGNKQVFEITRNKLKNDLNGTYHVYIDSHDNVHSIKYFTVKDNSSIKQIHIDGGQQDIRYLYIKETQIFNIKNPFLSSDKPFVTTFTPINCQIEVFFINGNEEKLQFNEYNFIQHIIHSNQKNAYYKYKVNALSLNSLFEEMCLVYVASTSLDKNAKLIVNEAIPISLKFDNDVNNINFIYFQSTTYEKGSLLLQTNSNRVLDVILKVNDVVITQTKIHHEELIMFEAREFINNYNYYESFIISLQVFVDKMDIEDTKDFKVDCIFKSYDYSFPSYINKYTLIQTYFFKSNEQYYYTHLGQNEEGEIIVDFEGTDGMIYIEIVTKENIYNVLDFFNNYEKPKNIEENKFVSKKIIHYDKTQTNKCLRGCYLFIGISPLVLHTFNKFSLYIKSNINEKTPPIFIPINKYINGYISDLNSKDSFTFSVPTVTEKIEIEFKTEICNMYIKSGTDKPNENEYEYIIGETHWNSVYSFTPNNNLNMYTLAITCNEITQIDYSPYVFRIRTEETNYPALIEVTTEDEVHCIIKENGGYCDFLIKYESKEEFYTSTIYARAENNNENSITIYARCLPKEDYFNMSREQQREAIPRAGQENILDSSHQLNGGYLLLNNLDLILNPYVLVSVSTTYATRITLLTSFDSNNIVQTFVPYYTAKLMNIYKQEPKSNSDKLFSFELPRNVNAQINFVSIFNHVTINCDGENIGIATDTNSVIQYHIQATNDNNRICDVIPTSYYGDFILSMWYLNQQPGIIINEIETSKLYTVNSIINELPVIYYTKILSGENVIYNFKYLQYNNDRTLMNDINNHFILEGYVVDVNFIKKIKEDRTIRPTSTKWNGYYDRYTGYGRIKMKIESINSEQQNYLLIIISQSNTYLTYNAALSFTHSVISSNEGVYPVLHDSYFYDSITVDSTQINKYKLFKQNENDEIMLFEFMSSNKHIDFAISTSDDFSKLENDTDLIYEDLMVSEGKVMLIIDLTKLTGNEIYLTVFTHEIITESKITEYTFKYTSNQNIPFSFGTAEIIESNRTDTIELVIHDFGIPSRSLYDANYIIRMYDNTVIHKDEIIDSFLSRTVPFKEIFTTSGSANQVITDVPPGEYSIVVISETIYSNYYSPMLQTINKLHHIVSHKFEEHEFNTINTRSRSWYDGGHVTGYMDITSATEDIFILSVKVRYLYPQSQLNSKEHYTLKAYFVDNKFIQVKSNNFSIEPSTNAFVGKEYSFDHHFVVILEKDSMNFGDYIYFELNKHEDNNNKLEDYVVQIIGYSPLNLPNFITSENTIYIGQLTSKIQNNYYLIERNESNSKSFTLELTEKMSNQHKLQFSIEHYIENKEPTKVNSTDLIIEESHFNGLTFVNINLPEDTSLTLYLVTIFTEDSTELEYSFKWSSNYKNADTYNYNLELRHVQMLNITELIYTNVLAQNSNNLKEVTSLIRIYSKESIEDINILNTMFIEADNDIPTISPVAELINITTNTEVNELTQLLPIPKINSEYIVTISVFIIDYDSDEEIKFGFDVYTYSAITEGLIPLGEIISVESESEFLNYYFIKVPNDYNLFTVLVKSSNIKTEVSFANDKIVQEIINTRNHIFNDGRQIVGLNYHEVERAGSCNIERTDTKLDYLVIYIRQEKSLSNVLFVVYPYNNQPPSYTLPQRLIFIDSFMQEYPNIHKIYKLSKENESDEVIEIEFSFISSDKEYSYSIEEYIEGQEPTFITKEENILKKENKLGKVRIAYNVKDISTLLLSFIQQDKFGPLSYEFKYKSYTSINDYEEYNYDPQLKISHFDEENDYNLYITLMQPIQHSTQTNYFYSIFRYNELTDPSKLNSILFRNENEYIDNNEFYTPIEKGSFEFLEDKEFVTFNIYLETRMYQHYYLVVFALYNNETTNENNKYGYETLFINTTYALSYFEVKFRTQQTFYFYSYPNDLFSLFAKIENNDNIDLTTYPISIYINYLPTEYKKESLIIKGYIVDETFIQKRKEKILMAPDFEPIIGKEYKFERNILLDFPILDSSKVDNKYVYINIFDLNKKPEGNYFEVTVNIQPSIQPIKFSTFPLNIITLNSVKKHFTYFVNSTGNEGLSIEFSEQTMSPDLDISIESCVDSNLLPTFKNESSLIMDEGIIAGKRYIVLSWGSISNILISFINKGVNDLAFYLNIKDIPILSEYESYNKYDADLIVGIQPDMSEISITFTNIFSHITSQTEEEFISEINFYSIDKSLKNYEQYNSVFIFDDNEHQKHETLFKRKIRYSENSFEKIISNFIITKKQTYLIKVLSYNTNVDYNLLTRFGYNYYILDTYPDYFYEIDPLNLHSFCINESFDIMALYMKIKTNAKHLPSFSFKYSNIKINGEKSTSNPFIIKGYSVDSQFIENRKTNLQIEVPQNYVEASYYNSESSALLSTTTLDFNDYIYIDIRSLWNNIESVCFDIVPTYPGDLPETPLVQDKYIMQKVETNKTIYKLGRNNTNDRLYTIDVIKSNKSKEYEFIIETYKEIPTNKSDVNFETKNNLDKTTITVNLTEEQKEDNLLLTVVTNYTKSNDDEFFLIQYQTFTSEVEKPVQIEFNETITTIREIQKINISFENIFFKYAESINAIKYDVRGYLKEGSISVEDIETYLTDPNDLQSEPIIVLTLHGDDNNRIANYSLSINNMYDKKELLLKMIAKVSRSDGKEEIYLYDISKILPVEIDEESKNYPIWLIIILIIFVLIVLVVIFLLIRKIRKQRGNIENSLLMAKSIILEEKS